MIKTNGMKNNKNICSESGSRRFGLEDKMKKKLLIVIAALMVSSVLLTGCGGKNTSKTSKTDKTDKTTTVDTKKSTTAKVDLTTKTENDKKVIMKVNGDPVSYAEFRYYFLAFKSQFDGGDDTAWSKDKTMLDQYKKAIVGVIEKKRVILDTAKAEKLSLTAKEIKTDVDAKVETQLKQSGTSLDKNYTTVAVLLYDQKVNATYEKLTKAYNEGKGKLVKVTDADALKYAKDNNYITAKHIMISTQNLSDADKAKKKELAQQILVKAKNGEDFNALIKQYGEDPGMTSNPDGYVFKKGDMMTEFETAAYALGDDQISDIVETSYGYHIIKKMKNDDKITVKAVKQSLTSEKMDAYMKTKIDKVKVVYTNEKAFKAYDFKTVK
jgi:PPIC-type PPIASE domain.